MCRYISWKAEQSRAIHEHSSPYKAGVILITDDNKFLLVKNYNQKWTFPKGGMEEDEDVVAAAARELKEETGIVLELETLKLYYKHYKQTYFICNARGIQYDENLIQNKSEITGIGWFCFQHLDELELSRPTIKILRMIRDEIDCSSSCTNI